MPEHCPPRDFDLHRHETWGGGAIMGDSEVPVSFVVRAPMPRRPPSQVPGDSTGEDVSIEPRGLPPPRLKTPPSPGPYRSKPPRGGVDISQIDPDQIIDVGDNKLWRQSERRIVFLSPMDKYPRRKTKLPEPVPGVSKPARGRHVPTKGQTTEVRNHCCPVEGCGKAFKKRDHLNRHVKCLHRHDQDMWRCYLPTCDKSFTREDNLTRHQRRHTHKDEIIACTPDDDFKGVHIQNPLNALPGDKLFDIKPFANIPIHPLPLSIWQFQEGQRRRGQGLPPGNTLCERYFAAHPEHREAAFRNDPEWQWHIPPAGDEFTAIDGRCLQGTFKLDIRTDQA